MPVQVFIRGVDGKTVTIDIELTDTVAQLKAAYTQKGGPPAAMVRLIFAGKQIEDHQTLDSVGVKSESTIHAAMRMGNAPVFIGVPPPVVQAPVDPYDADVKTVLRLRLEGLEGKKVCVLICIGSFDNGHGEESIRRQQCPPGLLAWCKQQGLELNIIHVDAGFAEEPGTGAPQIYDIDPWDAWQTLYGGKARHFFHRITRAKLSTYATMTKAGEYAGTESTLAGVDLDALGQSIQKAGGVFIKGNFYSNMKPDIGYGLHLPTWYEWMKNCAKAM